MKKGLIILTTLLSLFMVTSCNNSNATQEPSTEIVDIDDGNVQVDVDKNYALEVVGIINALNDNSSREDIVNALKAYNNLTERQKKYVTNYDLLETQLTKLVIFDEVDKVNDSIAALDDESSLEDLLLVVKEYISLIETYGEKWQSFINQENINKLKGLQIKYLEILINNVLDADLEEEQGLAKFGLISNSIDNLFINLEEDDLSNISKVDEYLSIKESASSKTGILYDRSYSCSYNNSTGKEVISEATEKIDYDLGSLYEFDVSDNQKFASLNLNVRNDDWREYDAFAFFVNANAPINDIACLIPNGIWPSSEDWAAGKFVQATPIVVDDTNHLYFYKLPLAYLNDILGEENEMGNIVNKTSLTIYFGSNQVSKFSVTDLVYLNKDFSELNALVDKANNIDISTNLGKTHFALLSEYIDEAILGAEVDRITGYSDYQNRKESLNSSVKDIFDGTFTIPPTWDSLIKEKSEPFGYIKSYTYSSIMGESVRVFADGVVRDELDWSGYNKLCMFIQLDNATSYDFMLRVQDSSAHDITATSQVFDDDNHIYCCEFDISVLSSSFTDNPWITINLSESINFVKVTNWIGIK